MKVIFLDVDGVLNSMVYYENVKDIFEEAIDPKNVYQLKRLVDATKAKIVLTSSWRGGWEKDPAQCHADGRLLNRELGKAGLQIFDKTALSGVYRRCGRSLEVIQWISECPEHYGEPVEAYVIIDDNDFDWQANGLDEHWVQTSFKKDALDAAHVELALEIMNNMSNNFASKKETLVQKVLKKFRK